MVSKLILEVVLTAINFPRSLQLVQLNVYCVQQMLTGKNIGTQGVQTFYFCE